MFGACKPQCGPCRAADPVTDRVKVDPALLAPGKENSPPMVSFDKLAQERKMAEEREKADAARHRIEAAEAERRRAEAEAAAKAEAERLEKELQRQRAQEAAEQQRLEEQHRLAEQRRLQEEQRCLEEQQARDAADRAEHAKDEAAKSKVQRFLKDNGFSGVNAKKTSLMSHKYALHAAVEKKDAEVVSALLRCKADPSLQNSSKKTPEQQAVSINKKGSHDQVLVVLRSHGK